MKKYIASTPNIMGGAPVIAGTRIPITVIIYRLKEGYTVNDIHHMYPWVSLKKLEAVLNELAEKMAHNQNGQKILQT